MTTFSNFVSILETDVPRFYEKHYQGLRDKKIGIKPRFEKGNTIETLIVVPQAKEEIEKYAKKECLITIILYEHSVDRDINAPKVFTRFSKVAMKETRGEGLRINNDKFKR